MENSFESDNFDESPEQSESQFQGSTNPVTPTQVASNSGIIHGGGGGLANGHRRTLATMDSESNHHQIKQLQPQVIDYKITKKLAEYLAQCNDIESSKSRVGP